MEARIILCRLPPGMKIATPPGGELPPQQPMSTYGKKPLPPLPPVQEGLSHQLLTYSMVSTSELAQTLSMIDDYDEDSDFESTEWDFSLSSRRHIPSWIPASPVPPQVKILDFDEASPRRRDSELGLLMSSDMHHFETLPARRNNHMEVSYMGAKDLYHAIATSIADSTRKKMIPPQDIIEPVQDSRLPPKNRLSFATKVLQSGRKWPLMGINTMPQSPLSLEPATGSGESKQSLGSNHPDMHAHSMDDDRLRVKYSDALFRVFRWSGERRRVILEGMSPIDAPPPNLGARQRRPNVRAGLAFQRAGQGKQQAVGAGFSGAVEKDSELDGVVQG